MAVVVILIIASRELRIDGSGTFSTLTLCLPIQQTAFIANSIGDVGRNRGEGGAEPAEVAYSLGGPREACQKVGDSLATDQTAR